MDVEEKVEAIAEAQSEEGKPAIPSSPTTPAATEPDYKTELETKVQQLASLEERIKRQDEQLNTYRGNLRQRQHLEAEREEDRQEIVDIKQLMKVMIESFADSPEHPAFKKLTEVETRSKEERQKAMTENKLLREWRSLLKVVAKGEGLPLSSDATEAEAKAVADKMKTDPAWRGIYAQAEDGFAKFNPDIVRKALDEAWDVADEVKEKRHKADMAEAKNQAKKDAENMVHDEFIKRGLVETVNPKAAGVSPASLKGMIEKDPDSYTAEDLETLKSLASKG